MIDWLSVMSPAAGVGVVEAVAFSAEALAAGEAVGRHLGHSTDGAALWRREASVLQMH